MEAVWKRHGSGDDAQPAVDRRVSVDRRLSSTPPGILLDGRQAKARVPPSLAPNAARRHIEARSNLLVLQSLASKRHLRPRHQANGRAPATRPTQEHFAVSTRYVDSLH
jgi:hypothetical protein